MKKYKKLILNIIPFLALVICFYVFYHLHSKQMVDQFVRKNEATAKNIARNIENMEKTTSQVLKNGIIAWSEMQDNNKGNTMKEMIEIRDRINVSCMTVFDRDGRMIVDSDGTHIPGGKNYEKYSRKYYSIFQKDVCSEYRNLLGKKNEIMITPFYRSRRGGVSNKLALLYNEKNKQLLSMEINSEYVDDILLRNAELYKNLVFLELETPMGNDISSYKKENFINERNLPKPNALENYNELIVSKEDGKFFTLSFSFGGLQKEICYVKNRGFTNSKNQYFYVLTAVFSKTELNHQLLILKLIYATFFLISSGLVAMIVKQFQSKDDIRLALKKQAFQIHHDIASQIQALDWRISAMTKERRVMEGDDAIDLSYSVETIRDVLADMYYLHDHSKTKEFKITTELVYPIIYSTFCSARLLLGYNEKNRAKLKIEQTKDFNLLINTDRVELRRVMLNLIKNAIESKGDIRVSLTKQENNAIITIKDTGCGIPPDILKRLMSGKTVTDGKPAGRGLGFSYAKYVIDKLGGTIKLESELNKGTTQTITFPLSNNRPSWFVERLNLEGIKTVVIVDDYEPIHKIWQDRLKDKNINTISCFNVEEFEDYMQKQTESTLKETFFLVDYSLQTLLYNGIILIAKYNLQERAILVTSKYLEASIKDTSAKNNIKIMPKEFIGMVEV